jgi:hypothetical protein
MCLRNFSVSHMLSALINGECITAGIASRLNEMCWGYNAELFESCAVKINSVSNFNLMKSIDNGARSVDLALDWLFLGE